jgi:archaellum component FlaF (FlaF/FlaG flagellin family)
MKTIILIAIFIFGAYLYASINQLAKDELKKATLEIPNKVMYAIAMVTK